MLSILNDEVTIEPTRIKRGARGEYLEVTEPPIRAKIANLEPDYIRRYEEFPSGHHSGKRNREVREMAEQKISPGLLIVGGLGLGLAAAAVGAVALAGAVPRVGFTLGIANPPSGTYCWGALFYDEPRIYSPVCWVDELWDYADDPQGRTDLMVRVFDSDLREIYVANNLGPIEKGKNYVFDCATGELSEA